MGAFPIIDSHVHLYDPAVLSYPWMAGIPALNRPHLPADFTDACGPIPVDRMIFVEVDAAPADRLAEADWVSGLAHTDPRIGAIVASAPSNSEVPSNLIWTSLPSVPWCGVSAG